MSFYRGSRPLNSIWLSVVIPAYNEASRIHFSLDRLLAYLRRRQRPFEVLVVDDGSRDDSAAQVRGRSDPEVRVIQLSPNRGKGAAVRCGISVAAGELILITDMDLSTPIEELERFEAALADGVSWVIGSRAISDSQPYYRQFMGRTFNLVVRGLRLSSYRDTQCGFKLCRAAPARDVFSRCGVDGFAFDVETLYLATRLGYKTMDLLVTWQHVPESRVRPLRDSAQMLWDIFRIRLRAYGKLPSPGAPLESASGRGLSKDQGGAHTDSPSIYPTRSSHEDSATPHTMSR